MDTNTFVWLFLSLGTCLGFQHAFHVDAPLENPDLMTGDILGIDKEDWHILEKEKKLWINGIIPYEEDPGLRSTVPQPTLQAAFNQFEKNTCLRFVPRTNETDYIRLFPGEGCYSYIGRIGGQQPVSLGEGCGTRGIIVHELGHVLGFYHEQNRSDRDEWLIIYWDNVKDGMGGQFFKLRPEENRLLTPFDYDSIMLSGSYTFSRDWRRLKTMVGRKSRFLQDITFKHKLSKSDIQGINTLYGCR
ncbi:astacin-like metalloprotease toxin 5 [Uloborus diversus]|uniref:astacin-like metalloprotease toxin 5 n=1 Tax=Uloborus diversus TaxID=327109 RepID=UPI0024092235|nr:astacin-like metalloprotease toxin 5 [Uloborus diversus]